MTNETTPAEGMYSDEGGTTAQDAPETLGNANPKLLSQRNEARKEANEYKAKYEELTTSLETVVEKKVEEKLQSHVQAKASEEDRVNFTRTFGEEEAKKVEDVLKVHPTLSYNDAYKIIKPDAFVQKGQSFHVEGLQPRTGQPLSPKEMSDEELEAAAREEAYARYR